MDRSGRTSNDQRVRFRDASYDDDDCSDKNMPTSVSSTTDALLAAVTAASYAGKPYKFIFLNRKNF